ncbi:hypothetical protein BGZ47_003325 [Haplosporangium gracile]|nr:hypothetical protein BGZ47_003325 [Haplosporangium gracile]
MSQHIKAEVFVFTPPISHPGYISINPRIESKCISESLKAACATNKLKLVTVTTALDNRFKPEIACDIDLSKAETTGQNCPITRKTFAAMGAAPCGHAEVGAAFDTDGTKRISVTVVNGQEMGC